MVVWSMMRILSAMAALVVLAQVFPASADDWAPRKKPKEARQRPQTVSLDAALKKARDRAASKAPRPSLREALEDGKVLLASGHEEEAAFLLKDALVPPPRPGKDREEALALYAKVLRSLHRLASLTTDMAPLFAAQPSAAELEVLAEVAMDLGDRGTAIKALERASQVLPGNAQVRQRLAAVAGQAGGAARGQPKAPRAKEYRLADTGNKVEKGPFAAWTAAVFSGDIKRARAAAQGIEDDDLREAALALVAVAAGDRAEATAHLTRGTSLVAATGRPAPGAVAVLLRTAISLREKAPLPDLISAALLRARTGTLTQALAAASVLATNASAHELARTLAEAIIKEQVAPHDSLVKGLLALMTGSGGQPVVVQDALRAALNTSDPALRARVVEVLATADPMGAAYPVFRRSVEDQVPLAPAEVAAIARGGNPDALAGLARAWDRLGREARVVAVAAAAMHGAKVVLERAASDSTPDPATLLALVFLGLEPHGLKRLLAIERSGQSPLADAARLGLALAGQAALGPLCGGPGTVLRVAVAGKSAVPALLGCAWHPDMAPELAVASLAVAFDPTAWRREAASAAREFARAVVMRWPDAPCGYRDLVDRVMAAAPSGAAAAALAGREQEVLAAVRAAMKSGSPARVLADMSGVLPGASSGVLGVVRQAGKADFLGGVYEEAARQ